VREPLTTLALDLPVHDPTDDVQRAVRGERGMRARRPPIRRVPSTKEHGPVLAEPKTSTARRLTEERRMALHRRIGRWLATMTAIFTLGGCVAAEGAEAEEEIDEPMESTSSSQVRALNVAPALQGELSRISRTKTGQAIVSRARARGLHTIKVGPLPGRICGLYSSNGVITIESPNNVYTFQRLAHELLHASGDHPHTFPDKGRIGDMCREAGAACPSWN
jgi:hypothetical protein